MDGEALVFWQSPKIITIIIKDQSFDVNAPANRSNIPTYPIQGVGVRKNMSLKETITIGELLEDIVILAKIFIVTQVAC